MNCSTPCPPKHSCSILLLGKEVSGDYKAVTTFIMIDKDGDDIEGTTFKSESIVRASKQAEAQCDVLPAKPLNKEN